MEEMSVGVSVLAVVVGGVVLRVGGGGEGPGARGDDGRCSGRCSTKLLLLTIPWLGS